MNKAITLVLVVLSLISFGVTVAAVTTVAAPAVHAEEAGCGGVGQPPCCGGPFLPPCPPR